MSRCSDLSAGSEIFVSIIIPTLNESPDIVPTLRALQGLRGHGVELIVADGGSTDGSLALVEAQVDRIIHCPRGRAVQMNAAAAAARGEWLLFLHADTKLPENVDLWLESLPRQRGQWGFFWLRLTGSSPAFRMIEMAINLRSTITRVATGDQCIFVRRQLFEVVGGYREIALMEDIAFTKQLRKQGAPIVWRCPVTTSSRRWEQNGIFKTMTLMWGLRLAYFLGVSPARLTRLYYG